jgi:repressor LexA
MQNGGGEKDMALTRRQRDIFEFVKRFIQEKGYSPSLKEVGAHFGLSSVATVHKHLAALKKKGMIKRGWNRKRGIDVTPGLEEPRTFGLPLLGVVAAGRPIEAVQDSETIHVPPDLMGRKRCYVLRVNGESMIEEHIQDGDYVIVEENESPEDGSMVVALLRSSEVTLKRMYRVKDRIRLAPSNPDMDPVEVDPEDVKIQGVVIGVMRKY